jgi:spore germination protein KC
MKKLKILVLLMLSIAVTAVSSGCWNYREVDQVSIVAGVAIDKGVDAPYELTAELIKISGGRDSRMSSNVLSAEGTTVFDAARNFIAVSGKRLYWSHTKVIIISSDIAREGVTKILEWFAQDAETREDIPILISTAKTAKEILRGDTSTESIVSNTIGDIFDNIKSLGKAPMIDLSDYDIEVQTKGASAIVPTVSIEQENDKNILHILGTAIIKDDKMVGTLNGDETKYLNFIRDSIKGGVLSVVVKSDNETVDISLEIFRNRTKITPRADDQGIRMDIKIDTEVAIDERIDCTFSYDEASIKNIEETAEANLRSHIEQLIKKVQTEFGADIFGFAAKLWEDDPAAFKSTRKNWDDAFKKIQVSITANVRIVNTAKLQKGIGEEA